MKRILVKLFVTVHTYRPDFTPLAQPIDNRLSFLRWGSTGQSHCLAASSQFNSERFTPEQKAKRPQGTYLAFSIGPRNCIGEAMAMYEMMIHISMLIQNVHFDFAPEQTIELEALVNLRPKHNLYMNPSPR